MTFAARPRLPFAALDDGETGRTVYLYRDPARIVRCDEADGVGAALAEVEAASGEGLHAVGWLAYELGYALEPRLRPLLPRPSEGPLLWFALFRDRETLSAEGFATRLNEWAAGDAALSHLTTATPDAEYLAAVEKARGYIAAGEVYQVNFTTRLDCRVHGDPLALYARLRRRQPVRHGGLIVGSDFHLLSLSPELFFARAGDALTVRPMKGTAPRGADPAADARARAWLAADPKNRAENLMILDLMRNDVGRIARVGSVAVEAPFAIETYPTLHQMTSSVRGRLRAGIGFADLVRALFPCGSVTGAPKIRAIEIIRSLERHPRGVYTGAIGRLDPDGNTSFNVAIRTLRVSADGRGALGMGGGIVFDSDPAAELAEARLKARFLTDGEEPFRLIETFRWSAAVGYAYRDLHLDRLRRSAAAFGFACDPAAVVARLNEAAAAFDGGDQRVRLLLGESGEVEIAAVPLGPPNGRPLRFALSPHRTRSGDLFLRHKTTRRALYDGEYDRVRAEGFDEAVFLNERGELTEGSRTTLFLRFGNVLATPPLSAGVLDGTLRRHLLDHGAPPIAARVEERALTPADLARADAIYLGNSVRGLEGAAMAEPAGRPGDRAAG